MFFDELVMVSTSPLPNVPLPVWYTHCAGSTPTQAGPRKSADHTFFHWTAVLAMSWDRVYTIPTVTSSRNITPANAIRGDEKREFDHEKREYTYPPWRAHPV